MSKLALVGGVAALALVAGTASANIAKTFTFPNLPAELPDNSPAGLSRVITVPNDGTLIKDVVLSVSFGTGAGTAPLNRRHSWAGDIRIVLTHNTSGTSVVVVDRPGFPAAAFGSSGDLVGTYSFSDAFAASFETAAAAAAGTVVIPAGNYRTNDGNMADFFGRNKAGDWTVNISDNAAGDTGSITGVSLTIFNVPTPGAAALFGLAGLAGIRRRR